MIKIVEIPNWTDAANCPVCESPDLQQFCANIQEIKPTTRWSICNNCNHVFVNPYPTKEWLDAFYREGYRSMTHNLEKEDPKAIPRRSAEEEMTRSMHVINNIIRWRGEGQIKHHLDIGSSTGALLASTMDRLGAELLVGVEPGTAWAEFSVESYKKFASALKEQKVTRKDVPLGEFIIYPDIDKVPKSPKFDLVTIIHTLENVIDPLDILKKAAIRMRSKGFMMIMVPYLFGGHADPLMFPHLHVFTRETMTRLFESAGLELALFETGIKEGHPFWPPPPDLTFIAYKIGAKPIVDKS